MDIEMKAPSGKFRTIVTDYFAQPPEECACDFATLNEAIDCAVTALKEPLTGAKVFDDEGESVAVPKR